MHALPLGVTSTTVNDIYGESDEELEAESSVAVVTGKDYAKEFDQEWLEYESVARKYKKAAKLLVKGELQLDGNEEYKQYLLNEKSRTTEGGMLSFWRDQKDTFPFISLLVRSVCSFGLTAAGVECDFSVAAQILTPLRHSLGPMVFELMLMLKLNYLDLPNIQDVSPMKAKDYKEKLPKLYRGEEAKEFEKISGRNVQLNAQAEITDEEAEEFTPPPPSTTPTPFVNTIVSTSVEELQASLKPLPPRSSIPLTPSTLLPSLPPSAEATTDNHLRYDSDADDYPVDNLNLRRLEDLFVDEATNRLIERNPHLIVML